MGQLIYIKNGREEDVDRIDFIVRQTDTDTWMDSINHIW